MFVAALCAVCAQAPLWGVGVGQITFVRVLAGSTVVEFEVEAAAAAVQTYQTAIANENVVSVEGYSQVLGTLEVKALPCVPLSCDSVPAVPTALSASDDGWWPCETSSDGCGGVRNCGSCYVSTTGGKSYECINSGCSCKPKNCTEVARSCGTESDDGCGSSLFCGSCPAGLDCIPATKSCEDITAPKLVSSSLELVTRALTPDGDWRVLSGSEQAGIGAVMTFSPAFSEPLRNLSAPPATEVSISGNIVDVSCNVDNTQCTGSHTITVNDASGRVQLQILNFFDLAPPTSLYPHGNPGLDWSAYATTQAQEIEIDTQVPSVVSATISSEPDRSSGTGVQCGDTITLNILFSEMLDLQIYATKTPLTVYIAGHFVNYTEGMCADTCSNEFFCQQGAQVRCIVPWVVPCDVAEQYGGTGGGIPFNATLYTDEAGNGGLPVTQPTSGGGLVASPMGNAYNADSSLWRCKPWCKRSGCAPQWCGADWFDDCFCNSTTATCELESCAGRVYDGCGCLVRAAATDPNRDAPRYGWSSTRGLCKPGESTDAGELLICGYPQPLPDELCPPEYKNFTGSMRSSPTVMRVSNSFGSVSAIANPDVNDTQHLLLLEIRGKSWLRVKQVSGKLAERELIVTDTEPDASLTEGFTLALRSGADACSAGARPGPKRGSLLPACVAAAAGAGGLGGEHRAFGLALGGLAAATAAQAQSAVHTCTPGVEMVVALPAGTRFNVEGPDTGGAGRRRRRAQSGGDGWTTITVLDVSAPNVTNVTLEATGNTVANRAGPGAVLTLRFNVSERLGSGPTVLLAGHTVTPNCTTQLGAIVAGFQMAEVGCFATHTVTMTDTSGPVEYSIESYTDMAGNIGEHVFSNDALVDWHLDLSAPILTPVTLVALPPGGGASSQRARVGSTLRLTFRSEMLGGTPAVTLTGDVTNNNAQYSCATGYSANWTGSLKSEFQAPRGPAVGQVMAEFACTDENDCRSKCEAIGASAYNWEMDAAPVVRCYSSQQAASLTLEGSGWNFCVLSTIATVACTHSSVTLTSSCTAELLVTANTPTTLTQSNVAFNISAVRDALGNDAQPTTAATDGIAVVLDTVAPTISNLQLTKTSSAAAGYGDTITLSWTMSEPCEWSSIISLMGWVVTPTCSTDYSMLCTASYTIVRSVANLRHLVSSVSGGSFYSPQFSITAGSYSDLTGNAGALVTQSAGGNTIAVDLEPPQILALAFYSDHSDSTRAGIGSQLILSFQISESVLPPTVYLLGKLLNISTDGTQSATQYTFSVTIDFAALQGPAGFHISVTDLSGNTAVTTNAYDWDDSAPDCVAAICTVGTNDCLCPVGTTQGCTSGTWTVADSVVTCTGRTFDACGCFVRHANAADGSEPQRGWSSARRLCYDGETTDSAEVASCGFSTNLGNPGAPSVVNVDTVNPTWSPTLQSNAVDPSVATHNSTVTLTLTLSEPIVLPTVSIGGTSVNATCTSAAPWRCVAAYTVPDSTPNGPLNFVVGPIVDLAGNSGLQMASTSNQVGVDVDMTALTLTTVQIASIGSPSSARAATGNTVEVSFTASKRLDFSKLQVKFKIGITPVVPSRVSLSALPSPCFTGCDLHFKASFVVQNTDPDGLVAYYIQFEDLGGANANGGFWNVGYFTIVVPLSASTDGSAVLVDSTAPTITGVTISSSECQLPAGNNARACDFMRVVTPPTRYEVFPGASSWTVAEIDCVARGGHLASVHSATDISSLAALAGESSLTSLWIGANLGVGCGTDSFSWTDRTPSAFSAWSVGEPSYDGSVAKCAKLEELTVATSTGASASTSSSWIWKLAGCTEIRAYACGFTTLPGCHQQFVPVATVGSQVLLSFTASEPLLTTNVVATVNGLSATVACGSDTHPTSCTAAYTVGSGHSVGTVPFSIAYTDEAGNSGTSSTTTTDQSTVTVDTAAPTVSMAIIMATDDLPAGPGRTVSIVVTSSETLRSGATASIAGHDVPLTPLGTMDTMSTAAMTTRTVECDWDGLDAVGQAPITNNIVQGVKRPASGNSAAICNQFCSERAECNYAARSHNGYCHTFTTCHGEGNAGAGWQVFEKQFCTTNQYRATHTVGTDETDGVVEFALMGVRDVGGNSPSSGWCQVGGAKWVASDWVTALVSAADDATFHYNSCVWASDESLLMSNGNRKTRAYATVLVDSIRITMNGVAKVWQLDAAHRGKHTLLELATWENRTYAPLAINTGEAGTSTNVWGLIQVGQETTYCHSLGFNYQGYSGSAVSAQARIGFQMSEQYPCAQPESAEGVGLGVGTAFVGSGRKPSPEGSTANAQFHPAVVEVMGAGSCTFTQADVKIDTAPPQLVLLSIASNNAESTIMANSGDVITVTIDMNEATTAPIVTIAGTSAVVSGSGTNWTAVRTVATNDSEGPVSLSVAFEDLAGNQGIPATATTDGTSVTIDHTLPTLTAL
jgi:hypothetical protein